MSDRLFQLSHLFKLVLCQIILVLFLTACGTSPQVMAQERIFPKLSLEFLGEYQLPKTTFKNTPVGGLSAITYDRDNGRFYALSDDRSNLAPARFYTLNLQIDRTNSGQVSIEKVEIEDVTLIKNERGKTYPSGSIDPEGMALSPRKTLFISSEGIPSRNINPFIGEFKLKTGQKQQSLRIPQRYLPDRAEKSTQEPRGVQENLGFEALTIKSSGSLKDDPFRLFTATESALLQDLPPETPATEEEVEPEPTRIRMMHYVINPIGSPILIAEHLYLLSPAPSDALSHGLTELTALNQEGYFLSLERSFGFFGLRAQIFQVVIASATDTSRIVSLKGNLGQVTPVKKKLLLDLNQLDIDLDNLEGMCLGPRLRDGSQTLVLVSDDNFREEQITQFLLFRLVEK